MTPPLSRLRITLSLCPCLFQIPNLISYLQACLAKFEKSHTVVLKMDAATLRKFLRGSEVQFVAMIGSCTDFVSKTELQEVLDEHCINMFRIIQAEFPNGYRRKLPPPNHGSTPNKNTRTSSDDGSDDGSVTPFPAFSTPKASKNSTSTRTLSTPNSSRKLRSSTMSGSKHMTEGGVGKLFRGGSRKGSITNLVSSDEYSSEGETAEVDEVDYEVGSLSMRNSKPRRRLVRGRRSRAAGDNMDQAAMWRDLEKAKEIRSAEESPSKKLRTERPVARSWTLRNYRSPYVRSGSESN